MRNTTVPALAAAGLLVVACAVPPSPMPPRLAPPETRSSLTVDMYGDTPIVDRYRWLEDQDSEEVLSWADRQNACTESFLSGSAERGRIRDRLTELWNFERFGAPSRHGPHWVWSKNDGLQNQAVLYVGSAPWVDGRVLLDPNTLSEDGTTALGATSFSEDGSRMAFSTSDAGSDWVTWQVLDVATGEIVVTSDMRRGAEEGPVTWDFAGVTVTDPTTGEVVVVFPREAIEAANEALYENEPGFEQEYNPDLWLLASLDGETFVVDDLDDGDGLMVSGPSGLTANGSRLLLQAGGAWVVYDLR